MDKPNCYECKHRRDLAGSAHSQCEHPAYAEIIADPLVQVMSLFASVGRVPPVKVGAEGIQVMGNPHGIRKGWFNHPLNFDPTWLESCDGFETKSTAGIGEVTQGECVED